ncbi:hypothetical protein [Paenibacillus aestuarii]|uniref:YqzL family protein n=1 Tax=Paenibacillus aestuarii TaxID=516965 RepID=A0ABW0K1T8_9BACL|nr:hypothetical protein [Paenibacillus aestuarii]
MGGAASWHEYLYILTFSYLSGFMNETPQIAKVEERREVPDVDTS